MAEGIGTLVPEDRKGDKEGEQVLRPVGFSHLPVPAEAGAGADGEPWRVVRWPVGAEGAPVGSLNFMGGDPVGRPKPRSFALHALARNTEWVEIEMERPLGVDFTPDENGLVRVGSLAPGSEADRRARSGRLDPAQRLQVLAPGDILRAVTSTQLEIPAQASLFGDLSGSQKVATVFGAPTGGKVSKQLWLRTAEALRNGTADNCVRMLLERPAEGSALASWTPQEFQPSIVDEPGEGPRVELAPNQLDGNAVWIALGASFLLLLLTGFGE